MKITVTFTALEVGAIFQAVSNTLDHDDAREAVFPDKRKLAAADRAMKKLRLKYYK